MRKLKTVLFVAFVWLLLIGGVAHSATLPVSPDLPDDWTRQWCPQKGGTDNFEPPPEASGFDWQSVCPSRGWRGYYAEFYDYGVTALETCYGETPTQRESDYVAVFFPRTDSLYRECWYDAHVTGGEQNPYLVQPSTLRYYRYLAEYMQEIGRWPEPGETGTYIGHDPVWPMTVGLNRWVPDSVRPIWPVHVTNALPPSHPLNRAQEPDNPPVDPEPEPETVLERLLQELREVLDRYDPGTLSSGQSELQVRE